MNWEVKLQEEKAHLLWHQRQWRRRFPYKVRYGSRQVWEDPISCSTYRPLDPFEGRQAMDSPLWMNFLEQMSAATQTTSWRPASRIWRPINLRCKLQKGGGSDDLHAGLCDIHWTFAEAVKIEKFCYWLLKKFSVLEKCPHHQDHNTHPVRKNRADMTVILRKKYHIQKQCVQNYCIGMFF